MGDSGLSKRSSSGVSLDERIRVHNSSGIWSELNFSSLLWDGWTSLSPIRFRTPEGFHVKLHREEKDPTTPLPRPHVLKYPLSTNVLSALSGPMVEPEESLKDFPQRGNLRGISRVSSETYFQRLTYLDKGTYSPRIGRSLRSPGPHLHPVVLPAPPLSHRRGSCGNRMSKYPGPSI